MIHLYYYAIFIFINTFSLIQYKYNEKLMKIIMNKSIYKQLKHCKIKFYSIK